MKVLLQRVSQASVQVDGSCVGSCGRGLLLLLGVTHADTAVAAAFLADKCVNLRIFPDDDGKMNRSLLDIGGEVLLISQFTLYGDARKGRRPSFTEAAPPALAEPLYQRFADCLRAEGINVATGRFGAEMSVSLVNDGPVTLLLEK